MAKITIKRRNGSERRDGYAALYAVLNISREKLRIPIGVSVSKEEWDPVKECIKGRGSDIRDRNLIISNVRSKISDILIRARLSGETLTKARFLSQYRRPGITMNFVEYAKGHLDELRPALQYETYRHHIAALCKIKKYNSELQLSDITPEFLRVYASYLRDIHHNSPGTISKNMCVIRTHYYAAMRAGLVKDNPFEIYKLPIPEPAVIYLTEDELNSLIRLYKSDTLADNEQDVLRFFLFMAFTAMHISDARSLQIEQIFDGEIHYRRIKTKTLVQIPLSQPAKKLVEYYSCGRYKGNLFRRLPTDQAFNRLIKRVCLKVGINKAVSAKTARHTFATLYYKKNTGDLGTLSKLLGHTSVTTTMIYAHIMKDSRISGISVFNDFM